MSDDAPGMLLCSQVHRKIWRGTDLRLRARRPLCEYRSASCVNIVAGIKSGGIVWLLRHRQSRSCDFRQLGLHSRVSTTATHCLIAADDTISSALHSGRGRAHSRGARTLPGMMLRTVPELPMRRSPASSPSAGARVEHSACLCPSLTRRSPTGLPRHSGFYEDATSRRRPTKAFVPRLGRPQHCASERDIARPRPPPPTCWSSAAAAGLPRRRELK